MEENRKRDRANWRGFGLWVRQLNRAPLLVFCFPFGFSTLVWLWGSLESNFEVKWTHLPGVGSSSGAMAIVVNFPSIRPSSSFSIGSDANRAKVFGKRGLHTSSASIWFVCAGTRGALKIIRLRLKEKLIWTVWSVTWGSFDRAYSRNDLDCPPGGKRFGPSDLLTCRLSAWVLAWMHVCMFATRRTTTGCPADVTVHMAIILLYLLMPQFFKFSFK